MNDLMRYAAALEGMEKRALPPVESWRPARTGEIDITIKSDGTWLHEGAPIARARLVQLFSTILRREGDDYFLVTPAEKLKIKVEDAPFLAVLMKVEGAGEDRRLSFTTNLGDQVCADGDHLVTFRRSPTGGNAPYIEVRAGLEAKIARAVYYDLAALAEPRQTESGEIYGVWSSGEFFPMGAGAMCED